MELAEDIKILQTSAKAPFTGYSGPAGVLTEG